MSKELIPFKYEGKLVRVVKGGDGEPWFVGNEVALILGYADPTDAIKRHCKYAKILKAGEKPEWRIPPRGFLIIPESDVYRLVMRSQLREAEKFQDWVVEVVLPQIRKTGGYIPIEEGESSGLDLGL
jgi:anti-repressor protein